MYHCYYDDAFRYGSTHVSKPIPHLGRTYAQAILRVILLRDIGKECRIFRADGEEVMIEQGMIRQYETIFRSVRSLSHQLNGRTILWRSAAIDVLKFLLKKQHGCQVLYMSVVDEINKRDFSFAGKVYVGSFFFGRAVFTVLEEDMVLTHLSSNVIFSVPLYD